MPVYVVIARAALALIAGWGIALGFGGIQGRGSPEPTPNPNVDIPEDLARKQLLCGPNSLYMFLKLCDVNVSFDELAQTIPYYPRGASLLDLKEAAAKFGVRAEVQRGDMEWLVRCPKPVIVHLNLNKKGDSVGHYVVVLRADADGVDLLDGIDGSFLEDRNHYVEHLWTGYALTLRERPWKAWVVAGCVAVWLAAGAALWLSGRGLRRGGWGSRRQAREVVGTPAAPPGVNHAPSLLPQGTNQG